MFGTVSLRIWAIPLQRAGERLLAGSDLSIVIVIFSTALAG